MLTFLTVSLMHALPPFYLQRNYETALYWADKVMTLSGGKY